MNPTQTFPEAAAYLRDVATCAPLNIAVGLEIAANVLDPDLVLPCGCVRDCEGHRDDE